MAGVFVTGRFKDLLIVRGRNHWLRTVGHAMARFGQEARQRLLLKRPAKRRSCWSEVERQASPCSSSLAAAIRAACPSSTTSMRQPSSSIQGRRRFRRLPVGRCNGATTPPSNYMAGRCRHRNQRSAASGATISPQPLRRTRTAFQGRRAQAPVQQTVQSYWLIGGGLRRLYCG